MVEALWPCCLANHSGFLPAITFQLTEWIETATSTFRLVGLQENQLAADT
jgi:hypothetical protein